MAKMMKKMSSMKRSAMKSSMKKKMSSMKMKKMGKKAPNEYFKLVNAARAANKPSFQYKGKTYYQSPENPIIYRGKK